MAVCCVVVIDFNTKQVVEKQYSIGEINFPYISGCLAFRELPLIMQTVVKLKHKPNIFLFDGNGILHSRGVGLATHASFYLEKPTIGIAKKYFNVEGAKLDRQSHYNTKKCKTNICICRELHRYRYGNKIGNTTNR